MLLIFSPCCATGGLVKIKPSKSTAGFYFFEKWQLMEERVLKNLLCGCYIVCVSASTFTAGSECGTEVGFRTAEILLEMLLVCLTFTSWRRGVCECFLLEQTGGAVSL